MTLVLILAGKKAREKDEEAENLPAVRKRFMECFCEWKSKQNKEQENIPLDAYVEKGEVVFYSKYWQYGLFSKLDFFFFPLNALLKISESGEGLPRANFFGQWRNENAYHIYV